MQLQQHCISMLVHISKRVDLNLGLDLCENGNEYAIELREKEKRRYVMERMTSGLIRERHFFVV